jgi:hypothetical protein
MGKFKTQYILFILFSTSVIAQNKTIVPKFGTVVFLSKTTINDKVLFEKSKKEFIKKFFDSLKENTVIEQQLNGKKVDTIQISSLINQKAIAITPFLEAELFKDENGYRFIHEFQDSIITQFKINNNNIKEDLLTLNTKTRIFSNDLTKDYYDYSDDNIIDIKEFRNEVKNINNFKCFKIIYTYSEPDVDEFSTLMSSYVNKREMWVTDKIKSDFHPIINDKQILESYYPLEITEYSDMMKGCIKEYKIEKIDLK